MRTAVEQMKFKFIRIATQRAQFIAQAKLHRQREFHATGTGTYHANARFAAGVALRCAHPFE